jgi:RNA polymerase sigma-70 factor, ECF subfamily
MALTNQNQIEVSGIQLGEVREARGEVAEGDAPLPDSPHQFAEINTPEFLARLRAGGHEGPRAFRHLVISTHSHLLRFIARHMRSRDGIQDVLQEIYLGVHKGLSRFQGKSKLSTWIYTLAYHKVCDQMSEDYRSRQLFRDRDAGADSEAERGEAETWEGRSPELPPDEAYRQSVLLGWIEKAAEELPSAYGEAYRLRDMRGMSGEEAAAALGINASLVRVRLHRARGMIAEMVRNRMG